MATIESASLPLLSTMPPETFPKIHLYPEDQWAATLKDRLESEGALKMVTMSALGTEWD